MSDSAISTREDDEERRLNELTHQEKCSLSIHDQQILRYTKLGLMKLLPLLEPVTMLAVCSELKAATSERLQEIWEEDALLLTLITNFAESCTAAIEQQEREKRQAAREEEKKPKRKH